jgi:hypothetical protein
MASLVHTSSALSSGLKIALVSHSIEEQQNGLITVACEYVCRATFIQELDAVFFPDAPPPIYPKSLDRRFLLAQRLFMTTRSVSTSNGLSFISANYVSGLTRSGNHAKITTTQESAVDLFIPLAYGTVPLDSGELPLLSALFFSYIPIVIAHEYVQVGLEKSGALATPSPRDLYVLLSASGVGVGFGPGAAEEKARNFLENKQARAVTLQSDSLSPSVSLYQSRYFIEEFKFE